MKKLTLDQWMKITMSLNLSEVGEVMKIHSTTALTVKGVEQSNSYEEYVRLQVKWTEEREAKMKEETQDAVRDIVWVRRRTLKDLGEQLDRMERNQEEIISRINLIR